MKIDQKTKDRALELAALYTSVAKGMELQFDYSASDAAEKDWRDPSPHSPHLGSHLAKWRVKPEPRTMFIATPPSVRHRPFAVRDHEVDGFLAAGYVISKWTEVLP